MKKTWDKKQGYSILIGAMWPWLRHPLGRIRQELSLMHTPGYKLRIPLEECTLVIFDTEEHAEECRRAMMASGNPYSEKVMRSEYSIEGRSVKLFGAWAPEEVEKKA